MEISPIPGIRVMPVTKVRPSDPELTAFFVIEPNGRPDDAYSPANEKASGTEEPEEETEHCEESTPSQINLFA